MKKQFELNGVNVELSKEQLQEMLKEFDKPVWSITKDTDGYFCLRKGFELVSYLWAPRVKYQENASQLVFKIAKEMGYLASKEQIEDALKSAYIIYFNLVTKQIDYFGNYTWMDRKIIDTKEHAEEIIKLIKSNEDLLKYIWMENE